MKIHSAILLIAFQSVLRLGGEVHNASAFKLDIRPTREGFSEGASDVGVDVSLHNVGSEARTVTFEPKLEEWRIFRANSIMDIGGKSRVERLWNEPKRSITIAKAGSFSWSGAVPPLSSLKQGVYKIVLKQRVSEVGEISGTPFETLHEASSIIRIAAPHQRKNSKVDPSKDLGMRTQLAPDGVKQGAYSASAPYSPGIWIVLQNSGTEPWFFNGDAIGLGIKLEVTDKEGRIQPLSRNGQRLEKASKPAPEDRFRSRPGIRFPAFDIYPKVSLTKFCLGVSSYVDLEPNQTYGVRVIWSGECYRSLADQRAGRNAVPFEVRTSPVHFKTIE